MRRVVVTGLGLVTPLACGIEQTWQRLLAGESGITAHREIRRLRHHLQDRRPGSARRRLGRHLQSRRLDGAQGAAQGRRLYHLSPWAAATQALNDADWHPRDYDDQIVSGVLIGSGIGGVEGIAETALIVARPRSAPGVAVLHPGPAHQSRLRLCVDRAFAQGPQSRRGHRVLDRRARHRRRRPADRARRCRRDGGGRHGIAGQSHIACRLCRVPGAVDRIQRHADTRVAALRPRSRRICHGRGRRRRGARRIRTRQTARRAHLCRTRRLRLVRRRLSHHRAGRGRRRRAFAA